MKNIVIYTGPFCNYCDAAKRLLTRNNAPFKEINVATVDVRVVDSDGSSDAYIAKTMSVPADTSLDVLGTSKLVLDAGDKIQVLASAASDIEFFASYLEITD